MKTKTATCLECGKSFEVPAQWAPRYKYCKGDHYRPCEICGTPVLVPNDKLGDKKRHVTCSKQCSSVLLSQAHKQSNASNRNILKVCECCGKSFYATSRNQRFCNRDHEITCVVCGKVFVANRQQLTSGTKTCSSECRYKLTFQTYHSHYDKDVNPECHDQLIAKMESTMMTRYGVKNALSKEGKELFHVSERMVAKYDVDHPMKSSEILEKRNSTNVSRYGHTCPLLNEEVSAKTVETLLNNYGVDNYAKSQEFLKQVISEPDKADKCLEFREDPIKFIKKHFPDTKPTLIQLSNLCGIRDSSIGWILDQVGHPDVVAYCYSRMEDELYGILRDLLGDDEEIERNTFKVITPYELDLYLPRYKLGIECNPTITHNSTIPGWSKGDDPKPSTYHKMKTDMCEEAGIFLFHIFGYEWSHRSAILKSMLSSLLGKSENKIYARQTVIQTVSDRDAMEFLNENHRQGGAHSKIRLGLYYNSELVSLMTFSKMRKTIGTGKANTDDCYELVRFCSKLNTSVVGGASKLFKHFVDNYDPIEIRSFSDRAHTKGNLYSQLGFVYDHTSDPGYMWVDLKTDYGYARNNAQKKNIKAFLNDDSINLEKTEVQIMKEHNFVQVFDSGVKLWIWRKEE